MRANTPAPLAAFYFTTFSVLGVFLPYFGLYAESLGFDGLQIGLLAAAFPLGKVAFGPLWALLADRTGRHKEIAVAGVAAGLATFALLLRLDRFPPMCAVLCLYSAFLSPQLPLVEATTLELAERHGWQYGRIRVWGSLGFIVTALALGPVFDRVAIRYVLHGVLAALAVNLWATAGIPRAAPARAWRRGDLRPAFLRPGVLAFLGCGLLMQASHGGYFAFFSIVLQDAGFRRFAIGALWALGVVAEMATMVGSAWLLRRWGVAPLMTGCLVAAAARWTIFSQTTWLPAVILAQLLHAFSFGAFHVAAVTGTYRLFPEALRSSGQSLYSGFTYGAGSAVGFFAAGSLFDAGGPTWLFGFSAATAAAAAALSLALWRERRLRAGEALTVAAAGGAGG
jgi:PPP family 3-phenylpropionic acid transporter